MKQIRNYDDGRVTLVRKIQNIELCTPYQYKYQLGTKTSSFKLEGCSELAMKICFSSLGRSQGGHVMLSLSFQPRYSTVLIEKSYNLLPIFSRRAAINNYILYSAWEKYSVRKNANFSALKFIVLNSLYHGLILAQNSYGERTRCYRAKPVLPYPRAFSL